MKTGLRVGAFSIVIFGVSALAVMLKQGRLAKEAHDKEKSGEGAEHEVAVAEKGTGATPAGGTLEAQRDEALRTGRALFDLPESISIPEVSDLMAELRGQKQEQARREATLELRERDVAAAERDVEARRSEVLALAKRLQLDAPAEPLSPTKEELDPTQLANVAEIVAGMESDPAAKLLETLHPAKAAAILVKMEVKNSAAVLGLIDEEKRARIAEALLKQPAAEQ
jgi:flagellar motility protein MotE (MotC chaperone)